MCSTMSFKFCILRVLSMIIGQCELGNHVVYYDTQMILNLGNWTEESLCHNTTIFETEFLVVTTIDRVHDT